MIECDHDVAVSLSGSETGCAGGETQKGIKMDFFAVAYETLMRIEGVFDDDPDDAGGPTKYGISLRWLKSLGDLDGDGFDEGDIDLDGDVDQADVKAITLEHSEDFYREHFWNAHGYDQWDSSLVKKVFITTVNVGPHWSHRILQRALRACDETHVKEDGIVGPITLQAVRSVQPYPATTAFRAEQAGYYRMLATKHPPFRKYLKGWLNRAYD